MRNIIREETLGLERFTKILATHEDGLWGRWRGEPDWLILDPHLLRVHPALLKF
jgi:hypothetical protein